MVGHHDHGLFGQAHTAALHGARDGRERLAGADSMVDQHKALIDAAPNRIHLVPAHFDDRIRHLARQRQVLPVVLAGYAGVE